VADNTEPLRLAYESSVRAIGDQAGVLESLRSRAGTMLAAAALVTSFFGGQALVEEGLDLEPWSLVGLAVAAFIAMAACTIFILWPFEFWFNVSAAEMLAIVDSRPSDNPVTGGEAYRELALRLEDNYDYNLPTIRRLISAFRLAILCLVIEVGAWVAVLWRL
jgi:hypothetical protein